jgi:membrane protease YdiL (CAAX protease family)
LGVVNRRLLAWSWLALVLVILGYLGNIGGGGTKNTDILYRYSTAVGDAVVYALILGAVLWIAGGSRELLALQRPRSRPRSLGIALAVCLLSLLVIDLLLDPFLHGGREQGVVPTHWMPAHAAAYAVNWIVVAGVAPVVEELTYRGLGYSLLRTRFGNWTSIIAVALLFAGAHGLVQAFPELAILGGALAWLRVRTQSVYPGMFVHAAFNSIALAYVFWAH